MQAKLPNPFWMKGVVGGHFSVMNGLVKGNCRFEVTIGKECEIEGGSALEALNVIAEITPNDGEKEVSVFNAAQGVFNIEVGKTFELLDLDGKTKAFRVKLDEFELLDGKHKIPAVIEWNSLQDVAALAPLDVLPSQKQIRCFLQISFEEKANGRWVPVVVQGKKITESKTVAFVTGKAPNHIPAYNVAYSYPMAGQANFHPGEHGRGYIKLKQGQPELFSPGKEWRQIGRFKSADGETQYFDFTHEQGRQINFDIPQGLPTHSIYALEIVNVPASQATEVDVNVARGTKTVETAGQDAGIETRETKAEGQLNLLQEKAIYSAFVQTSRFRTFSQKIAALEVTHTWRWPIYPGIHELKAALQGPETFDTYEINGTAHTMPLVNFEASLETRWFEKQIQPLVYPTAYPPYGLRINWRDNLEALGVPPAKAVYIRQANSNTLLEASQAKANIKAATPQNATLVYGLPLAVYRDYAGFRQQAAARATYGQANGWMNRIITTPMPSIKPGTTYKVKMRYTLPGIQKTTTEKEIVFTIN